MEMSIGKRIRNIIITVLFLLIITVVVLIIVLKVQFFQINGNSMEPTLTPQELVLALPRKTYERGDLIAFDLEGTMTIKRIIGIPGDTVFIDEEGIVYINDEELKEDYIKMHSQGDIEVPNPYKVQKGEYFVLGDNRQDSKDSRLLKVAGVHEDDIQAKVVISISKFKRIK